MAGKLKGIAVLTHPSTPGHMRKVSESLDQFLGFQKWDGLSVDVMLSRLCGQGESLGRGGRCTRRRDSLVCNGLQESRIRMPIPKVVRAAPGRMA